MSPRWVGLPRGGGVKVSESWLPAPEGGACMMGSEQPLLSVLETPGAASLQLHLCFSARITGLGTWLGNHVINTKWYWIVVVVI